MRPTREEWAVGIAEAVSIYADCRRRLCGAVLFDSSWQVKGTGYNGTRAGTQGCLEGACARGLLSYEQIPAMTNYDDPDSPGYCISTHAEVNCLLHSIGPFTGFTMAVSQPPCNGCQKILKNSGLSRVIFASVGGIKEISW